MLPSDSVHLVGIPDDLPALLAALVVASLTLAALLRRGNCPATRAYALYAIASIGWLGGNIAALFSSDPLGFATINLTAVTAMTMIGPAVYQLATLAGERPRHASLKLTVAWTGAAVLALVQINTPLLVGVYSYDWGLYPQFTLYSLFWVSFELALVIFALRLFWRGYRDPQAGPLHRTRCRLLLISIGIGTLGGLDLIPTFGLPFPPVGTIFIPVSFFIATYVMSRYGLAEFSGDIVGAKVLESLPDPVLLVDRDGMVRLANPAAIRMFRCSVPHNRPLADVIDDPALAELIRANLGASRRSRHELRYHSHDGRKRTLWMSAIPLPPRWGASPALVCAFTDITATRNAPPRGELKYRLSETLAALTEANSRLRHQSNRDELTGVYNRRYSEDALQELCAATHAQGVPLSVLLVQVGHLGALRGRFGDRRTDTLLRELAALLQEVTDRPGQVVGRLGESVFVLILPGTAADQADQIATWTRSLIASLDLGCREIRAELRIEMGRATTDARAAAAPSVPLLLQQAQAMLPQQASAAPAAEAMPTRP